MDGRAIRLLEDRKIDYDYIDLDDDDNDHFVARLVTDTKQNTVPYVYIRSAFVGGFNALNELDRLGQLPHLILSAEERKNSKHTGKEFTVAARPNTDEVALGESESEPKTTDDES